MLLKEYHREAKQSGSIISALMSVLLLSITLGFGARAMTNAMRAYRAIELESDKQLIKRTIVSNLSCQDSMSSCTGNTCSDFASGDGTILLSQDGSSKIGSWNVKTCCRNGTTKVLAALGNNNDFSSHPISKKIMTWDEPSGEVIDLADMCQGAGSSTGGGSVNTIYGPMCYIGTGSCAHPAGLVSNYRGCCPDGRDGTKPSCTTGTEILSYWDRTSDWGMNGRWVVLCQ